jgi:hypothetical protein
LNLFKALSIFSPSFTGITIISIPYLKIEAQI